jgi:LPS-assembly protein
LSSTRFANMLSKLTFALPRQSIFIVASFLSVNSHVNAEPVCEVKPIKSPKKSTIDDFIHKPDEVIVTSESADLIRGNYTEFNGNVTIFQQEQTIQADNAIYDELSNQFRATGNIKLLADAATVTGLSIFLDEENQDLELLGANYQFGFNAGRGQADVFSIESSNELELKGATFTTCPGDDPSWLFSADEIQIDQEKGWGEAWNTVFKIADVPIIYVPYITFPISDKRKTGLLFPEVGNSTRYGSYIAQPIYFNLADNYDLTLTPKYMSDRGLLFQSNFRHINHNSDNILQLEYLNEDKSEVDLGARHLAYWQHESNWQDKWNVQLQWTDLSDDNFISEFTSDYHHQADTHLNNFVMLNYYGEHTNVSLLSQDMYELGPHIQSYRLPIQMTVDWSASDTADPVKLLINSQYSLFENEYREIDEVQRLHLAPEVTYQFNTPAFQLLASGSYLSTLYKQSNSTLQQEQELTRNLAKARILAGISLEKETTYFKQDVRQTLEPKIQYLYVEDVDQSNIGLYDSQLLKEDYFSLFRDNNYSGIDNISAANQATIGFSTSIFDKSNKELFRFGLGQVYKFNKDKDGTNDSLTSSKPAVAVEWFGQLTDNWQLDGGILYNQDTQNIDTGFVSLDYWLAKDKNFQFNHRYAKDVAGIKINQAGIFASYQINSTWAVATSYHQDLESDTNMDALVGFEYRSCCWSIQLAAKRQIVVDLNNDQIESGADVQYDNGISFNFKISGLGGDLSSNIANLFSESIFAYRRPYLITN